MSEKTRRRSGGARRAKRRRKVPLIVALVLVAAALVAAGVWLWARDGSEAAEPEETGQSETSDSADSGAQSEGQSEDEADAETDAEAETDAGEDAESEDQSETQSGGALPQVEQSAGLTLSSVYTSSILNPDCGGEYAEEIASLEVTNSSESYLVSATLTATMSDGTEVLFEIYDLPAGATAEIFDTENQSIASGVTCTSLVCTSEEYIDGDVLLSGSIEVAASGSDAVLTNIGSSALKNLTVVYHCDMAGQFLGGASYTITIDNLAAGESFTLSDSALMGEVAVVRIINK